MNIYIYRETSKTNFLQKARAPISSLKLAFGTTKGEAALNEIVLEPTLDRYLSHL
jgi:hypothetical protein